MDHRAVMIALRLLHILAGLLWVGAMVTLTAFLAPAVRELGPVGGKVMTELMLRRKLRVWLSLAMGVTILSGLLMMWRLDVVTQHTWIRSSSGKMFVLGAIAALVAGIVGGAIAGPANQKLAQLGTSVAAAGGPPSAEQQATMAGLRAKASTAARLTVVFLLIAVAAMAVARYT